MPEKKHSFIVRAAPDAVAGLLDDLSQVADLFPPFDSAQKSEGGFHWRLKGPLKIKAGTPYLLATITEQDPGHISWKADSPHLHWSGTFHWVGKSEGTEVVLELTIADSGPLGKIHEAMISVQILNLVRYFEQQVKKRLEKSL